MGCRFFPAMIQEIEPTSGKSSTRIAHSGLGMWRMSASFVLMQSMNA